MNQEAINSVYMFIAELQGYKQGTVQEKILFGKDCYRNGTLPEETPDDLHEIIWLQRLYKELEALFLYAEINGTMEDYHWQVPIELDASALA